MKINQKIFVLLSAVVVLLSCMSISVLAKSTDNILSQELWADKVISEDVGELFDSSYAEVVEGVLDVDEQIFAAGVTQLNAEDYAAWKASLKPNPASGFSSIDGFAVAQEGPYGNYIRNEYIEAYIASSGSDAGKFTMGTTGGDPANPFDNNSLLLFGHPNPWSSETLIMIDGVESIFYTTDVEFNDEGTECVAKATYNGVEVQQILKLEVNQYTGLKDQISIRYEVVNRSNSPKQVGIRIMLDTMLGNNDGCPFRVNGQDVTREREFTGGSVPEYWQAFDDLSRPNVIATGFFYKTWSERPDKVQFAHWPAIVGSSWDYQVDTERSMTGETGASSDTAVAAYFNPQTVRPGASRSVVTYYGISSFANSDMSAPLAVSVSAPLSLTADSGGYYAPNPFRVTAYLQNVSNDVLTNVTAELKLASAAGALLLYSGTSTIYWNSLQANSNALTNWDILVIPQSDTEAVTLDYSVRITAFKDDELVDKTIILHITLYPVPPAYFTRTVTFNYNDGTGRTETVSVRSGELVEKPVAPLRAGYIFRGWYSNAQCYGEQWFNIRNAFLGERVYGNMSLYAKWVPDNRIIIYGVDNFLFPNAHVSFKDTYEISPEAYAYLIKDLTNAQKQNVLTIAQEPWGGSCFGMAAVVALAKTGKADPNYFQLRPYPGNLYGLQTPRAQSKAGNERVNDLVSFYQLIQYTPNTLAALTAISGSSPEIRNKAIVDAVTESAHPVMIGLECYMDMPLLGNILRPVLQFAHVVVGYDIHTALDGSFIIDAYDPNDRLNPMILTVSSDYSTATFARDYDDGDLYSKLTGAFTMEDSGNNIDEKNLEAYFKGLDFGVINPAPAPARAPQAQIMQSQSAGAEPYDLYTNYWYFTVELKGAAGATLATSTVIYDYVDGDLKIDFVAARSELGSELVLQYALPALDDGQYYVITSSAENYNLSTGDPLSSYSTVLLDNSDEGFRVSAVAAAAGKTTITAGASVTTLFAGPVAQKITSTLNDVSTSWYTVSIEGTSSSFTAAQSKSGAFISSAAETTATISVNGDTNSLVFKDVKIGEDGVTIKENAAGETVIVDGDGEDIVDPGEFGYSVTFYALGGTPTDPLLNVPQGSTITAPASPLREGYIFGGWYKSAAYADQWNFAVDVVNGDTILYAKWELEPGYFHTVIFRAVGFDDIIILVPNGGSIEDIPDVPEKAGYSGYWDISDFSDIRGDLIVSAIYVSSDNYCLITATAGTGGTVTGGGVHLIGTSVILIAAPSSGYTFDGWYEGVAKVPGAGATYTFVATVNRTLQAKFTSTGSGGPGGPGGGGSSDSSISPTKATFNASEGKDITVTLTRNGNTLSGLKNGNTTLKEGADYTVSGNTITLKTAYLSTLAAGEHIIIFNMSGGTDPKLTISVTALIDDTGTPLAQTPGYTPMKPLHPAGTKVEATKTNNPLILSEEEVAFPAVKIGGYNWIKLRDFAMLLNGTAKQFSVSYDAVTNIIDIRTGGAYAPLGDELEDKLADTESAIASPQRLRVDGEFVDVAAYNIKGYNYFRLRDLAIILNFAVIYAEENGQITLDFANPYQE